MLITVRDKMVKLVLTLKTFKHLFSKTFQIFGIIVGITKWVSYCSSTSVEVMKN